MPKLGQRTARAAFVLSAVAFIGLFTTLYSYQTRERLRLQVEVFSPLTGEYSRKGNEHLRSAYLAVSQFRHRLTASREAARKSGDYATAAILDRLDVGVLAVDSAPAAKHALQQLEQGGQTAGTIRVGVVGFQLSSELRWAEKVADPEGPLLLVGGATKVADPTLEHDRLIRFCPTNRAIAGAMLDAAWRHVGEGRYTFAVVRSDSVYAKDLARILRAELEQRRSRLPDPKRIEIQGNRPAGEVLTFERRDDPLFQRLEPPPEELVILFSGSARNGGRYAEMIAGRLADYPGRFHFIGSDGLATADFLRSPGVEMLRAGERTTVDVVTSLPRGQSAAIDRFSSDYAAQFGEPPDGYGWHVYRATRDLLEGVVALVEQESDSQRQGRAMGLWLAGFSAPQPSFLRPGGEAELARRLRARLAARYGVDARAAKMMNILPKDTKLQVIDASEPE